MENKPQHLRTVCPYWSRTAMNCKACSSGIHIPLDDHIEVFCTTPVYRQCPQYIQYSDDQFHIEKAEKARDNRRKYTRFHSRNRVTIASARRNGDSVIHWPASATTLDLSTGGMRLAMDQALADDTVLRFSFDETFPEDLRSGLGRVTWCNKLIDEPGYQVGIAFSAENVLQAMEKYLAAHTPPRWPERSRSFRP